jgi:hypothetical protein
MRKLLPGLLLLLMALPCVAQEAPTLDVMQTLDRIADFHFAIMSDHKGSAPANSPEMARMARWIDESGDRFVIGLGDHLCARYDNPFLDFIGGDQWWARHFYPNIADGENEYYGTGQGDWGAGGRLLEDASVYGRPGVTIRDNKCEYYARIFAKGFVIHLIQLHYSDNPPDISIAFSENTRRFLVDTLTGINKGPRDIVIAAAHSRSGYWVHELSPERRALVMDKCDLVLSATTHNYGRQIVEGYEDAGALCLNTGSVCYAAGANHGYIQVHVFGDRHPTMLVQYVSVTDDVRRPANAGNPVFVRELAGRVWQVAPFAEQ